MATVYSTSLPHVNSTAESFVSAYYSSWDNDRATLKAFYLPQSRIVWNGNPISGSDEMNQFIDKMPASKHDVRDHSFGPFDADPLHPQTKADAWMIRFRFRHLIAIPSQVRSLSLTTPSFPTIAGPSYKLGASSSSQAVAKHDSETSMPPSYASARCNSRYSGATDPGLTGINIIVSGSLLLYNAAEGAPAPTAPRNGPPGQQRHRRDPKQQNEDVNSLPKFFSQAFTLVPTQGPTGNVLYAIQGETFRYVG